MNAKQYNNVINHTLKHDQSVQQEDTLTTARAIFKNAGVALPNGDLATVSETLATNNYMGWHSCTMQEAQEAANNGKAAIGIGTDRIVVLSAHNEEEPVAQTASVMTINENTSAYAVDGLRYYAYGGCTTTILPGDDLGPIVEPNLNSKCYTTDNPLYRGGYQGQCTWYAYGRALEIGGVKMPTCDAGNWYSRTNLNKGIAIRNNSVAVFGPNHQHVVFVERWDRINGEVTFTEANWNGSREYNGIKTCRLVDFPSRGNSTLIGYIYTD